MFELVAVGFGVGAIAVGFLFWRMRRVSKLKAQIKSLKTRQEVEDEIENLSDDDRYAAGNKWL